MTGVQTCALPISDPAYLTSSFVCDQIPTDANGNVTLAGSSTAYFLQAPGPAQTCASGLPLTYQNVGVYRIGAGGTFNLTTWQGTGGTSYVVSANAGVLSSTQAHGDIY